MNTFGESMYSVLSIIWANGGDARIIENMDNLNFIFYYVLKM
jgi:hypothetical protein